MIVLVAIMFSACIHSLYCSGTSDSDPERELFFDDILSSEENERLKPGEVRETDQIFI